MKHIGQFLQTAADASTAAVASTGTFIIHTLLKASEPAVAMGLIFWLTTTLAGYPMTMFPWWLPVWSLVQAVAITSHLAVLPTQAAKQAKAGDRVSLTFTLICIVLLTISYIPFLFGFLPTDLGNTPIFNTIRILALLSILLFTTETFTTPGGQLAFIAILTSQEPKELISETSIPMTRDEQD